VLHSYTSGTASIEDSRLPRIASLPIGIGWSVRGSALQNSIVQSTAAHYRWSVISCPLNVRSCCIGGLFPSGRHAANAAQPRRPAALRPEPVPAGAAAARGGGGGRGGEQAPAAAEEAAGPHDPPVPAQRPAGVRPAPISHHTLHPSADPSTSCCCTLTGHSHVSSCNGTPWSWLDAALSAWLACRMHLSLHRLMGLQV